MLGASARHLADIDRGSPKIENRTFVKRYRWVNCAFDPSSEGIAFDQTAGRCIWNTDLRFDRQGLPVATGLVLSKLLQISAACAVFVISIEMRATACNREFYLFELVARVDGDAPAVRYFPRIRFTGGRQNAEAIIHPPSSTNPPWPDSSIGRSAGRSYLFSCPRLRPFAQ
jgi:hypothetical protein